MRPLLSGEKVKNSVVSFPNKLFETIDSDSGLSDAGVGVTGVDTGGSGRKIRI